MNNVNRDLAFKIYCIELYKIENNLSGKETIELFKKHQVLDYIKDFYEVLHINGPKYILEDINDFIKHA